MEVNFTLEFWLKSSLYDHEGKTPEYLKHMFTASRFNEMVSIYEPFRDQIEDVCKSFNTAKQSLKSFRNSIWVTIPEGVQDRTQKLMEKWAREDNPSIKSRRRG